MRRYLPLIQAILCLVAFFGLQVMVGCRRLASTNPGETTSNIRAATTRKVWYGFDFANTHDWTYLNRRGDNSNSEQQCYLPARIGLSSGLLTITAQVSTQTCSDTTNGTASFNFSSGFLQLSTINFVSGTLSARIKFTGGSGPWPAFWLLGSNCQATNPNTADNTGSCNWPQTSANSDEIDIAEILGSTLTQVNQQIHADSNTGACAGQCLVTTSDVSAGFHVYTLVRVAGTSLTWFIDGVQTCQLTSCISSTPMGIMLDVALGGAGGTISSGTLPQTLQVSYVTLTQ